MRPARGPQEAPRGPRGAPRERPRGPPAHPNKSCPQKAFRGHGSSWARESLEVPKYPCATGELSGKLTGNMTDRLLAALRGSFRTKLSQ
eukprot:4422977-Pyramimonas_sp.AAC.1